MGRIGPVLLYAGARVPLPNPFNILMASNDMAFEVDEELILVGMICEALLKRHAQQIVA